MHPLREQLGVPALLAGPGRSADHHEEHTLGGTIIDYLLKLVALDQRNSFRCMHRRLHLLKPLWACAAAHPVDGPIV